MAYHSLTFGTGTKSVNTWDDWHLVPDKRPTINPPKVKTNYIEIPGMDGSLDYSEALGSLKYDNREGSWTFYVMNDYGSVNYDYDHWYELYHSVLDNIHGRKVQIWSEDDPNYVYYGRLTVEEWSPEKDYSQLTISYVIEPYKYKASLDENGKPIQDSTNSTAKSDWLWDDLFDNTIIYGKFDVIDNKVRTLINNTGKPLEISVTTTSKMYAMFDGKKYELQSGRNRNSGIILDRGNNVVTFYGNGQVTIDYDKDGVAI